MSDQVKLKKSVDLALQGGGSHGALTWGVLDRLLEDNRIRICSISGTSAGAMNAVVLADGLEKGGAEGGREALAGFWKAVSDAARWSPLQRTLWDRMSNNYSLDHSAAYIWFEQVTRLFSPYQLNPFDINPLRDLIAGTNDFDAVNRCSSLKVFVTATNVRTGRAKVFTQPDLSVDTVMASACLPFMFKAVEIDGEAYWDGGYIGNPALYPLVDDRATRDIVIVQINPLIREELPTTGRAIINRLNEVTFNAALLNELRSIHLLHELIEAEGLESERYRDSYVHLIHAHEEVQDLSASSKFAPEWSYLLYLKERGRTWAESFIDQHFDDLGVRSTLDLGQLFSDSFRLPQIEDAPSNSPATE
ncbi:patatin-like phospholipase family protein [Ensifer aridi]|uniref:patatin-like phospholipase family protein n=1 Tax=Ensifer aridi TaxID=1708715 RepID=UPI000A0FE9E8|nr:patatin-like phospholipase family protein [Ensifer aridi]